MRETGNAWFLVESSGLDLLIYRGLHLKDLQVIFTFFAILFLKIEYIWVALVHKTIQVSSVHLNKTSSAHCIVHPSPRVKSLSAPICPPIKNPKYSCSRQASFLKCFYWFFFSEREEGWGGRERERNKHQYFASRACPDQRSNLQPRHMPWPGMEPTAFCCTGQCSTQLSQGQASSNSN